MCLLLLCVVTVSADALQVNGFEVHDPEEAVLLFLEQDQDITLTVARPIKVSDTTPRSMRDHTLGHTQSV